MITPLGQAADFNLRTIAGPAAAPDSAPIPSRLDNTELQISDGRATARADLPGVAISAPELPFNGSLLTGLQDDSRNGGSSNAQGQANAPGQANADSDGTANTANKPDTNAKGEEVNAQGLTKEEEAEVQDLKERDREVRAHEQAHARVGGQYAGSPQYDTEKGPDGRQYAVGGHVSIDISPVAGDPDATVRKMEQVRAAALAPAEPSGQDQRVAAEAQQKAAQARVEAAELRREEFQANRESASAAAANQGTDSANGPSVAANVEEGAGSAASASAGGAARRLEGINANNLAQQSGQSVARISRLENAASGFGLGLSDISRSSNDGGGNAGIERQRLAMADESYRAAARLNSPEEAQGNQFRLSA